MLSSNKTLTLIGEELLNFLDALGEVTEAIIFRPHAIRVDGTIMPRSSYYGKLRKFEHLNLVKQSQKTGPSTFVLTEKGKQLFRSALKRKKRNDGLSTLIIFDIPIKFNRERTTFRRFLNRHGYTLIQKSALIGPWEISSQIRDLAKELKISDHITIFGVKKELF